MKVHQISKWILFYFYLSNFFSHTIANLPQPYKMVSYKSKVSKFKREM